MYHPSPSLTPPPIAAEFVPWPDIVWQIADLPIRPLELSAERVVAVTVTDAGFVAVGYRETDGVRDGKVWRSTDAETWELVDDEAFAGVDLVDVSPAPKGFVALGVEGRVEEAGGGHAALFQRFQLRPEAARGSVRARNDRVSQPPGERHERSPFTEWSAVE